MLEIDISTGTCDRLEVDQDSRGSGGWAGNPAMRVLDIKYPERGRMARLRISEKYFGTKA